MSDRQPSEEPEEQVDLAGDDDVMDDEEGYRRRRHHGGGEDSGEPEEEPEEPQIEVEGDGDVDGQEDDAGMAVVTEEPSAGSGDDMDKVGADGPEDEEEKIKWDELLALPPQGCEVFLGGLPRDTTKTSASYVRLTKDKETKENKGFAFVTFTAKDVAQRAIEELHDKEHKGRTLRCSLSQAKHRLFVGNVPKGLSEAELTSIIKGKGPGVVNIEMFKDLHDPSRNRGFLFVEYYNHACADYARLKLSSPDFKVDGSQLTVSWAEPKGSTSSSSSASDSAAQVKTIYVKNLPENVSKEKVKVLFEEHGEVTKVVLPPAKAGHKRDFGFVHFAERSSALKVVKGSDKYEIDGLNLEEKVWIIGHWNSDLALLGCECSGSVSFALSLLERCRLDFVGSGSCVLALAAPRVESLEVQGFNWIVLQGGDRLKRLTIAKNTGIMTSVGIERLPVLEQLSLRGVQWSWGAVSYLLQCAAEVKHLVMKVEFCGDYDTLQPFPKVDLVEFFNSHPKLRKFEVHGAMFAALCQKNNLKNLDSRFSISSLEEVLITVRSPLNAEQKLITLESPVCYSPMLQAMVIRISQMKNCHEAADEFFEEICKFTHVNKGRVRIE